MQFFQSWKESATLFIPKNFKLFFLVTVKSIIDTYITLLRYCWPFLGLYLMGDLFILEHMPAWFSRITGYYGPITLANSLWGSGLLFLLIFLAARPSVVRKKYWYFISYWYYWGYVALFMLLSTMVKTAISTYASAGIVYSAYLFFIMIWSSFFILFLLDSDGTIVPALGALWRGLKMVIYNLPAVILLWLVAFGVSVVVVFPVMLFSWLFTGLLLRVWPVSYPTVYLVLRHAEPLIGIPIFACFMTNLYIKRLHDQFGLYFETKEKE